MQKIKEKYNTGMLIWYRGGYGCFEKNEKEKNMHKLLYLFS